MQQYNPDIVTGYGIPLRINLLFNNFNVNYLGFPKAKHGICQNVIKRGHLQTATPHKLHETG